MSQGPKHTKPGGSAGQASPQQSGASASPQSNPKPETTGPSAASGVPNPPAKNSKPETTGPAAASGAPNLPAKGDTSQPAGMGDRPLPPGVAAPTGTTVGTPPAGGKPIDKAPAAKPVASAPAKPGATPPTPPRPPAAPASGGGGGFGSGLAGGIVGALLVGLAAWGLISAGMLQLGGVDDTALQETSQSVGAVSDRLAAVEQRLQAEPDDAAATTQLRTLLQDSTNRLAALEGRIGEMQASAAPTDPGGSEALGTINKSVDAVGNRLAELEQRLAQAPQGAALDEVRQSLGTSTTRLQQLEASLQTLNTDSANSGAQLAKLQEPIDRVTTGLAGLRQEVEADRVAAAESRTALQGSIADARTNLEARVVQAEKTLQDQMVQITQALNAQAGALDALNGTAATLQGQIEANAKAVETNAKAVDANAQAVEAMNLRRERTVGAALVLQDVDKALQEGGDIATPTARLEEMAGSDGPLAPAMADLKAAGASVPSVAELRQGLQEAADALRGTAGSGGWLGQTVGNLSSLVEVEGPNAPNPTAASVGKAEAALEDGDIAGAIAPIEALPDDQRQLPAVQSWLGQAHARLAAENAVAKLQDGVNQLLTTSN